MKNVNCNFNVPIMQSVKNEENKFMIKGVAINSTVTRNNVRFLGEELMKASDSLKGKPILKNHSNDVDSIMGKVISSNYNAVNENLEFTGQIMDKDMQEMIEDGRICSVSIGAIVGDLIYSSEEDEKAGILTAKGVEICELSLVVIPADPNATFVKSLFDIYNKEDLKTKLEKELKELKEKREIMRLTQMKNKLVEENRRLKLKHYDVQIIV